MNETDKVKGAMRWIFASWITVLSIFVGIASFHTYQTAGNEESAPKISTIAVPVAPKPLALQRDKTLKVDDQTKVWEKEIAAYEKQVNVYEKQLGAYEKQITAYKTQMELAAKSDTLARYKAVITDTIVAYLGGGFFTAFLAWIFTNLAAGAVERVTESRRQRTGAVNAERFIGPRQPSGDAADSVSSQPLNPIKVL